eukprot:433486-Amphidinium_carterae.1
MKLREEQFKRDDDQLRLYLHTKARASLLNICMRTCCKNLLDCEFPVAVLDNSSLSRTVQYYETVQEHVGHQTKEGRRNKGKERILQTRAYMRNQMCKLNNKKTLQTIVLGVSIAYMKTGQRIG